MRQGGLVTQILRLEILADFLVGNLRGRDIVIVRHNIEKGFTKIGSNV